MEAGELILAVREWRETGRFDTDRAAVLTYGVEEVMPVRYAMPYPPGAAHGGLTHAAATRTRRGQWHEAVQHLTDLDYLSPDAYAEWHRMRLSGATPPADLQLRVLAALEEFAAEEEAAIIRELPPARGGSLAERWDWAERYLPVLVYRLTALTSFDGDLTPRPGYRIGERTPFGRSLAFRVRALFFDYRAARRTRHRPRYFEAGMLPQLVAMLSFLPPAYGALRPTRESSELPPELQALLLDADVLFAAYQAGQGKRIFLQYRLETVPPESRDGAPRTRQRGNRWVRREGDRLDTGVNHFGVRLVQLFLWRAGFYTGRPDGDIGPLTHAAVLALLEQEEEYGEWAERKLDKVLLPTDGELDWVLDLRRLSRLLERYRVPPAEEARAEEDLVWERIRAAGQEAALDRSFAERQREVAGLYGSARPDRLRRVYYGIRGLIRGVFRAVGRVIKWIAGAVERLLGAVFDFVKAVAQRIQEGVGLFFTGFRFFAHYLLGRPLVTLGEQNEDGVRPVLLTRFRIDFDVVNLFDAHADRETVARHAGRLRESREGAVYFLSVVGDGLRAISLLQPPVGWLRLAVTLARRVRDFLSKAGEPRAPAIA